MPSQPSWISRVPDLLEKLNAPGAPPFLDRPAVEVLFGLRRRQAIELLGRCGGYQVGKTFLAPREAVLQFLLQPELQSTAAREKSRFERMQLALGQARQELGARSIPVPAAAARVEFSGLPPGVRIEAGRLTVSFSQPAELLEKLVALAQALTDDYETFERLCQDTARLSGGLV